MDFCNISHNIKIAVVWLYKLDLLNLEDALPSVSFSDHTFYWILALWLETGEVVKPKKGKLITLTTMISSISWSCTWQSWLLSWWTGFTLDKLVYFYALHYHLLRTWESCHVPKRLKHIAQEWNKPYHVAYMIEMAQNAQDQIIFLYETSNDQQMPSQDYRWLKKDRFIQKKQEFIQWIILQSTMKK